MPTGWARRPRGPLGCLLWVAILVIVLLLLSVLFGGFQRGTKAGPAPHLPPASLAS